MTTKAPQNLSAHSKIAMTFSSGVPWSMLMQLRPAFDPPASSSGDCLHVRPPNPRHKRSAPTQHKHPQTVGGCSLSDECRMAGAALPGAAHAAAACSRRTSAKSSAPSNANAHRSSNPRSQFIGHLVSTSGARSARISLRPRFTGTFHGARLSEERTSTPSSAGITKPPVTCREPLFLAVVLFAETPAQPPAQ